MSETPTLKRRGFLMAGVAVLAAPAIVRAASLMPVRALRPSLVLPGMLGLDLGRGDFTMECWMVTDPARGPVHLAEVTERGVVSFFQDGVQVTSYSFSELLKPLPKIPFGGLMDEFRVTRGSRYSA